MNWIGVADLKLFFYDSVIFISFLEKTRLIFVILPVSRIELTSKYQIFIYFLPARKKSACKCGIEFSVESRLFRCNVLNFAHIDRFRKDTTQLFD